MAEPQETVLGQHLPPVSLEAEEVQPRFQFEAGSGLWRKLAAGLEPRFLDPGGVVGSW